jgi:hypothetical protein
MRRKDYSRPSWARFSYSLGTVVHVQLVKDVGGVPLGGPDGDDQLLGDLAVRPAGGHQTQHVQLALSQDAWLRRFIRGGRDAFSEDDV